MGNRATQPLSLEEAKAHMRAVWAMHSPSVWMRRHPWETVLTGLVAGVVVGLTTGRSKAKSTGKQGILAQLQNLLPTGLGQQLTTLLLQGIVSSGAAAAGATAASPPGPQPY